MNHNINKVANKVSCIIVSLMFSLSALAEGEAPYNGSRIFWDTATKVTVFPNGGYARMIQLQDGRLMAVTENGGIDISFSSNLGSTWSSQTKIVSNPAGVPECVPDLIQLADGTILVGYNPRPSAPYSEDRKFGIRLKRSTDNGVTWSDEIFVVDADYDFSNGCWEPSFLQLPSGEVHLYYADEDPYRSNNDQQISLCRSFDGGLTWSAPEKICYRQGWRDGMPSAVILQDGNIAMAYEDNGWAGFEWNFVPSIAVCPLETNWHDYWVDASSPNRWQARNYNFVKSNIRGGAPYIRVLPWGETVLSHQGDIDNSGKYNMYVYVGNEHAQDFKAACAPFSLGANEQAMWTSLAVIDTGIVVAVAPIKGRVEMMKGYPVRQLNAPYGKPVVDGKQTRNEGYYKPTATQMILGREYGTRFTGDFAYNNDSLYFTSRVSDTDQVAVTGSFGDGISLYLDTKYASATYPEDGIFRFFFRLDGTMQVMYGEKGGRTWQRKADGDTLNINYKVTRKSTYYIIEAAIPWAGLGFDTAPVEQMMRVNVMLQNRSKTNSTPVYEMLPDAKRDASWSWMDFVLLGNPASGIGKVEAPEPEIMVDGTQLNVINGNVISIMLYALDGRCIGNSKGRNAIQLPSGTNGIVIARILLDDGIIISRKIKL